MAGKLAWIVRMTGTMALVGGLGLSSGCNRGAKADADLLMQENGELRQRISQLESEIASTEEQIAELRRMKEERRFAPPAPQPAAAQDPDPYAGGGDRELSPGLTLTSKPTGEVVLAIAGDVLFDSGSAELKRSAKGTLDRVADLLKGRYGGNVIRVEGYTDTDPIRKSKWGTNERLSAERALAVETYLVSRGVAHDRIYSAAFGPANPKNTKATSRRVEVVVLAGDGAS